LEAIVKKLFYAVLLAASAAAIAEVPDAIRQQNLDRVFIERAPSVSVEEHAQGIDAYVKALPVDQQLTLEFDSWKKLFKEKRLTRLQYVEKMLKTNEEYGGDPLVIDYWAYVRMLDKKVKAGTLPEEEYEYLQGKKYEEMKLAIQESKQKQDRDFEANQAALRARNASLAAQQSANDMARAAQLRAAEQAYDPTGDVLTNIGNSLRSRSQSTNCTTTRYPGSISAQTVCR
jgi:hypothetical protein